MSETPRQPSQEELEAMYKQMREAPVQSFILQGLSLIQSGAQAKIGQGDAKTLMDVVDAGFDAAGTHLGEEKAQRDELLSQLRAAPMRDIVVQGITLIAQGVELKIGRADARVLIDLLDALAASAGDVLGDMKTSVETMISQLKAAQVQAENQLAAQGVAPDSSSPPASAPPGATQPPGAAQSLGAAQRPTGEKKETDKLWIPGR